MLLDSKTKLQTRKWLPISADGKVEKVQEKVFAKWSNVNMYRTSYNDMSNRVSVK